jgi:DNA invertase Pin-like site-specific DNA recombinase
MNPRARQRALTPDRVKTIVRVIIYARISEADDDDTPDRDVQVHDVMEKLDEVYGPDGYEVVAVLYDHDKSAYLKKVKRPYFDEAMALCEAREVDVLAAWAADRVYRRVESCTDVIKALGDDPRTGVAFVCAMEQDIDLTTADGRYAAIDRANRAEFESARKSERIRGKVKGAYRNGWAPPKTGYGYEFVSWGRKKGGTYEQVPVEVDAIHRLAKLLTPVGDEDGLSAAGAAEVMNAEGWPRRDGGPWTADTVRKLFERSTLAGIITDADGEEWAGNWEPILDEDEWRTIRNALRNSVTPQTRKRSVYWLRGDDDGLGLFDVEGTPLTGARLVDHRTGLYDRRVYRSRRVSIDAAAVEAFMLRTVRGQLSELTWDDDEALRTPADDAVATHEARLAELAGEKEDGEITKGEWRAARQKVLVKLEAAKAERKRATVRRGPAVRRGNLVKRWDLDVKKGGMSDEERRRLARWAVGPVIVQGGVMGKNSASSEAMARRLVVPADAPLRRRTSAAPGRVRRGRAGG